MHIEKIIWEKLNEILDPEIPLTIVEMGLIYDVEWNSDTGFTKITMTLTTPGCPLHSKIKKDIEDKLNEIDEISEIKIDFVFDPKWTIDMMSPEARKKIGR